jgi:hypothetical protein
MREQQVRLLLAAAVAYDNRRPGDGNIRAWIEAADRGRWNYEEALEALHQHYAESTDFLMPGHITQRLRSARRLPPGPAELRTEAWDASRTITAGGSDPYSGARNSAQLEDIHREAMQVDCPQTNCHQRAGWRCINPISGEPAKIPHFPRSKIARRKAESLGVTSVLP